MKKFKSFYKMALPLLTVSAMTVTIPLVPVSNKSENNNNNKLKAANKVKAIQEFTIDTWTISGNIMSASSTQLQGEDKINFDVTTSSSDNSISIKKLLITSGGANNSSIDSATRRYNLKFNNFEGEYSAYTVKELNFGGRGVEISESSINDSLYTNYPVLKGIATVYIPDSVSTLAQYSFSPYALKDIVLSETTPVSFDFNSLQTVPYESFTGILPTTENADYYLNNLLFPTCYSNYWKNDVDTLLGEPYTDTITNKYDTKTLGVTPYAHAISFDDSITIIPWQVIDNNTNYNVDNLDWKINYNLPTNLIVTNSIFNLSSNNLLLPSSVEVIGNMKTYHMIANDLENFVSGQLYPDSTSPDGLGMISTLDFSSDQKTKNLDNEFIINFTDATNLKAFPLIRSERIFDITMPDSVLVMTELFDRPCDDGPYTKVPNLKTLRLSPNLQYIPEGAFGNRKELINSNVIDIEIPKSITKISSLAFCCFINARYHIKAETPTHFTNLTVNSFYQVYDNPWSVESDLKFFLPSNEALNAFKSPIDVCNPGYFYNYADWMYLEIPVTDPDGINIKYNDQVISGSDDPLAISGHENITGSCNLISEVLPESFDDNAEWSLTNNDNSNILINKTGTTGTISWQNLSVGSYEFGVRANPVGFKSVFSEIQVKLTIEKAPVTPEITDIKVYDGEKEVTGETPIKIESETGSGTHTLTAQVIGTGDFDTQVNWNLETTSLSENVSVNNGVVKWQNLEANGNTYNFKIAASANGKPIISKEINFELTVGQAPVTPEITDIKVYSEGKMINTNSPLVIWNENKTASHTLTAEVIGTGDYDKTVKWNLETTSINENITFENGVINWTNLEEGKYEFKVQVTANSNESVSKDINIELNIGVKPKKDNTMIYAIAGSVGAIVLIAIIITVAIVLKKRNQ